MGCSSQCGGVYVGNEGFTFETANQAIESGEVDAVAFGRLFIANPDLPRRFATGAALNPPDPTTFYGQGPKGYTDYPAWMAMGRRRMRRGEFRWGERRSRRDSSKIDAGAGRGSKLDSPEPGD